MEEIKAPKKERKFLKAVGNIAKVLVNELVMGIARKFIGKAIDKVGNKRQGLSMALIIIASTFAIAQYPTTGNKQRLGFQTTADGLLWRGSLSDTASIQPINNQSAWVILDTINLKFYSFDFTSNVWNLVGGAPGLTMPFDSITFNTAKNGTVGVGEVEYNDTQGSLIQGLKGGNVTNVIGQQLHQRVNNRTGVTLTKGTAIYLSGSQGNRITVAKALGVTDAFSANTFGIVAENILHNQSGYVITEGLIKDINTSALVEDSAVYLSPTVAGGLTSTKPQAPQHTVYIGVCVKSNAGSGELFCKIRNGQELDELHNVRISSPIEKSSLYYSGGLWRDTTAALLVSDTASMLANYNSRINLKLNISDTASMLTRYFRDADTSLLNLNSRFASKLNLSDTASMLTNYARKGTFGTVTSVSSGSSSISVSTPTTTPIITIADAGLTNSGVMTAGDQQFQGEKRFFGIVQFIDYARFNSTTYTATRIAGLSSTNRLSDVTLGSGLSLSAGVLSATSGGVTSVTASTPLSSSGGATPNITITDAGTGASGVVNTGTQIFAGNKTFTGTLDVSSTGTFGGRVKTNWLERNYAYSTSSSFTVSVNTTWQDINTNVLTTLTLPSAVTYPGKEIHIRQTGTGSLQSASSNIIPFNTPPTGSTSTGILTASLYEAVTLVSDGTNWIIMQRSGN